MRLSVALCTYDGARWLPDQLDSIAAQTRPPDELVVGDDRSSDATVSLVQAFAARAPFPVRLAVNERNLGSTRNFEATIARCRGDVIALADQDDVWRPVKLERMAAVLAQAPEVGLVFSDAELVDEALRPLGRRLWPLMGGEHARRQLGDRAAALRLLISGWTVTGATLAFRAEFRALVLPIPTEIAMIHDGWIAAVVSAVARVHFIDEPLMLYRQHGAQQIGARAKPAAPPSLRRALRRPAFFGDALQTIALIRERLRASGVAVDPTVRRELEASATHFAARSGLPASWRRRLPLTLRELVRLRYHRYGNGLRSAAKDLLLGSRPS